MMIERIPLVDGVRRYAKPAGAIQRVWWVIPRSGLDGERKVYEFHRAERIGVGVGRVFLEHADALEISICPSRSTELCRAELEVEYAPSDVQAVAKPAPIPAAPPRRQGDLFG